MSTKFRNIISDPNAYVSLLGDRCLTNTDGLGFQRLPSFAIVANLVGLAKSSNKILLTEDATKQLVNFISGRVPVRDSEECLDLYAPFDKTWVESVGPRALFGFATNCDTTRSSDITSVYAVATEETHDGHLIYFLTRSDADGMFLYMVDTAVPNHDTLTRLFVEMASKIFSSIRHKDFFSAEVKINEKIRSVKSRDIHRVRKVIYLTHKSSKPSSVSGIPVEWKHCWETMGHWRRVAGVGKNRKGEYEMNGITWVLPHVKGNKSAPLVKKTRVSLQ